MFAKIGILICIVIILSSSTQVVDALDQFKFNSTATTYNTFTIPFVYSELIIKNNPTVCVHEPMEGVPFSHEQVYQMTNNAVDRWVNALIALSGADYDAWSIYVAKQEKMYQGDNDYRTYKFFFCDINVIWRGAPALDLESGAYVHGFATHHKAQRVWHDVIMYTWDYRYVGINNTATGPDFNVKDNLPVYEAFVSDQRKLEDILVHELGHNFGMNHALFNGKEQRGMGFDPEHADVSMMYKSIGARENPIGLKDFELYAMIYKYGTDGWAGWENVDMKKYIEVRDNKGDMVETSIKYSYNPPHRQSR